MNTLYADGIADIAIINNVVRIDLFRLEPDRSGGESTPAVRQVREVTLALPLDGLLGSLDLLDRVRADLLRGTTPQPSAKPAVPAHPAAIPAPLPDRSPNFS